MQLIYRFRLPALLCALAVLVCGLISRPFSTLGIADEGPYILTAQKLAATGHLVYNGWVSAMLGWQLYVGAAFIKLFGFSFTTVRMSTLVLSLILTFVLQRTLVRANISERNATLGTLALVLSPLYLMVSVTFMSDISGLLSVTLCLYGCLRALHALTSRTMITWLCFAVATNAIFGTSRQIAWLGVLAMVPSTLWLLRSRRRVVLSGALATLAGVLFIFGCMHWFAQQPYTIPAHLLLKRFPVMQTISAFVQFFLDLPFLLLPIAALFIPAVRGSRPGVIASFVLVYLLLCIHPRSTHHKFIFLLEPTAPDHFGFNVHGVFDYISLKGNPPTFFHSGLLVLLTIVSLGGLLGLITSLLRSGRPLPATKSSPGISWSDLAVLLVPFTFAYLLLLVSRAAVNGIYERYTLPMLVVLLLVLMRYYQEQIQTRFPLGSVLLVGMMAICGIVITHNTFALYRARVALAAELRASGIADTSVDNGWEYNMAVELRHADHINDPGIVVPANAYVPTPPLPAGTCPMAFFDDTPHIRPIYGVSFDPNACYGPAPFAPVTYSRWLTSTPGTLYVVRYTASAKS